MALCGGYDLVYPFITYEEEEKIKDQVALLKQMGHQGKSYKQMIGLDAPKSLKERLASMQEKDQLKKQPGDPTAKDTNGKLSSMSLQDAKSEKKIQLGENSIEMAAITTMVDDLQIQENQQGSSNADTLSDRWLKQVKYENFMECARKMWDQFTSGA